MRWAILTNPWCGNFNEDFSTKRRYVMISLPTATNKPMHGVDISIACSIQLYGSPALHSLIEI